MLSDIFDVIQSEVALQKHVHWNIQCSFFIKSDSYASDDHFGETINVYFTIIDVGFGFVSDTS